MSPEAFKKILEAMPLRDIEVTVDGGRLRYIAVVTSPDYEGVSDYQRQHDVWMWMLEKIASEHIPLVEFVFTWTPAEKAYYYRKQA
jgi:acid stress-induced BolA-like protein IbaG/YrbA